MLPLNYSEIRFRTVDVLGKAKSVTSLPIVGFKRGSVAARGILRAILNAQRAIAMRPPHDGASG
jgi:hypothetical protein